MARRVSDLPQAARSLRRRVLSATRRIPTANGAESRRLAVVPWRLDFIRSMFAKKPYLVASEDRYLSQLISGVDLCPAKIAPELVPCRTREDFDLYDYFRLSSSFPTSDRPGRRLKFLLRDVGNPGAPLMGLCCLSSAVRQLRVRDDWIGWTASESRRARVERLAYVMDVSTCLSLPPYSFLTAGKLLAAAMASNEVRSVYVYSFL